MADDAPKQPSKCKSSIPGLNLGFLEDGKPKDKENVATDQVPTTKPSPEKIELSPDKPKRSVLSPTPSNNNDDTVKAALIRDRMEAKVSQETQESVKAALVRTMMDGTVSQDTQDSVKAGLVRTQMDAKVSHQTQQQIKKALQQTVVAQPPAVAQPVIPYAVEPVEPVDQIKIEQLDNSVVYLNHFKRFHNL